MSGPRILVSWYTRPGYIPPFRLSDRQVTLGPSYGDPGEGEVFQAFTPFKCPYDLGEFVDRAGIGRDFDLVVVWADASRNNLPMGLKGFDCPKVLCVGDTQHKEQPLRTMVGYAVAAGFDHVVSSHNRHHLHWFAAAGIPNVAWIPGLKVRHLPQPPGPREKRIAFVGNAAASHPWRQVLLDALRQAELPVLAGNAPREAAAEIYARSLLAFNCSLNGDLNLRIFEVLSAGGCLLTDRLTPQSGLSLLLEEDRHYVGYGSPEELVDKARYYLGHSDQALAIAAEGAARYAAAMTPDRQRDILLDWALYGRMDPMFKADWDSRPALGRHERVALGRRIDLYETLQEAHREKPKIRVLFTPGVPASHIADAADLGRAELAVLQPPSGAEPAAPGLVRSVMPGYKIGVVPDSVAGFLDWDFIVATEAERGDPVLATLSGNPTLLAA